MGHHSDITKNRTAQQNWQKEMIKTNQTGCQDSNIKGAAETGK